jgi:antitoxin (DNA-binding transcriptional repressor) of toxin-antitoxin stability system
MGGGNMATQVNLYEAKTQLSSLVERAAKGEEIIIAKAGQAMAKLVALDPEPKVYRTFGQNLLGITFMADDWEKDIPLSYFQDEGAENPFGEDSPSDVKTPVIATK